MPVYPRGVDLRKEARIARGRFYPVTILYTSYAALVVGRAASRDPKSTGLLVASGIAVFTLLEYLVHRFLLHGRFPDGPSRLQHLLHRFLDTMHGDHHLRPWDGMHINGFLDTVPFAVFFALLSFSVNLRGAPVFVATVLQSYVIEEWVHYSVHFHRFKNRYFEYIRRHHFYHHSPRGTNLAYGLTSGLWDAILVTTRIPPADRGRLYERKPARGSEPRAPWARIPWLPITDDREHRGTDPTSTAS
jgi:sterol desaturase/sphingolipid hydroxylase (fatty acid hydroxylase superfamily)